MQSCKIRTKAKIRLLKLDKSPRLQIKPRKMRRISGKTDKREEMVVPLPQI